MFPVIRLTVAALALAALLGPAVALAQDPAPKPAEATCLNAFDKPVKVGTKWCRAEEFWVCKKDGTWFNLKQSCAGGTKGGAHPMPRKRP